MIVTMSIQSLIRDQIFTTINKDPILSNNSEAFISELLEL